MKYVRFANSGVEGKIHIVPKHTGRTLCGYPAKDVFVEMRWPGLEASCLNCVESLDELVEARKALNT